MKSHRRLVPQLSDRELVGLLLEADARRLSLDFAAFAQRAWQEIDPVPLVWNWHYDLLAEWLTLARIRDPRARKLIINVPPRTGKSTLCTVLFPVWCWTSMPSGRWMFISYASDLSYDHSRKRRDLIRSNWFQLRWEDRFQLAGDQNVKGWFDNTQRGSMHATAVGASVGGFGGDLLIDDPNNPLNPESDTERRSVQEKIDIALATRLDDAKSGLRIVIQQRTHTEDVTGHLLQAGGWTHLRLPMEADEVETFEYPISRAKHVRQPGELLFPDRFGPEEVAAMKGYFRSAQRCSAQLQQQPTSIEGDLIKRAWWRYYDAPPAQLDDQLQSWDCTFKETQDGSFVVGQVWGRKNAEYFLLDEKRARMDFPSTCDAIMQVSAKWPQAGTKLVEAKANGPAVIDALRRRVSGLIPVEPRGSKEARLAAVSPAVESGNCYLPRSAPFTNDFIEELAAFPNGVNDDRVDAFSQALDRWVNVGPSYLPMTPSWL